MNTPQSIANFIAKWGPGGAAFAPNEQQGAQQHFIELCAVLGVPTPAGDALEALPGRKVDLMTDRPIENPYLRAAVDATRQTIYAESPGEALV